MAEILRLGFAGLGEVATAIEGPPLLAVRSSALDEDGVTASFAGVHETELGRSVDEVESYLQ